MQTWKRDLNKYMKVVIVGEGQRLFLKLLEGQMPESQRVFTLADIGNEPMDISQLDIPDVSDFDLALYPYMAAGTSFSCPYQCRFYNVAGFFGKYRKKSVRQAVYIDENKQVKKLILARDTQQDNGDFMF
jgi:radical SAM superfamily enzyme YgiQ (UPF0313 family)